MSLYLNQHNHHRHNYLHDCFVVSVWVFWIPHIIGINYLLIFKVSQLRWAVIVPMVQYFIEDRDHIDLIFLVVLHV